MSLFLWVENRYITYTLHIGVDHMGTSVLEPRLKRLCTYITYIIYKNCNVERESLYLTLTLKWCIL